MLVTIFIPFPIKLANKIDQHNICCVRNSPELKEALNNEYLRSEFSSCTICNFFRITRTWKSSYDVNVKTDYQTKSILHQRGKDTGLTLQTIVFYTQHKPGEILNELYTDPHWLLRKYLNNMALCLIWIHRGKNTQDQKNWIPSLTVSLCALYIL